MPLTEANGIQIAYDVFGNQSKPAVLLIAGLMAQLPCWNDEFCNAMADRGFYVPKLASSREFTKKPV